MIKMDSFNEDGPGGVDFNRNFTFNYESFGPGAGMHPVSEPETKAVADFLFERFNIYSVVHSDPRITLESLRNHQAGPDKNGIIRSIVKDDEPIYKLISDKYHEITGVSELLIRIRSGNFNDWAYFHYGRYSFSTPAWWFPAEKGKNTEAAFLKYCRKQEDGKYILSRGPLSAILISPGKQLRSEALNHLQ